MTIRQDIDLAEVRRRIEELRSEHRDLDDAIGALAQSPTLNHLQLQRMKKRKLMLKDEMSRLEGQLLPDIIA
jgi:hypothetical protein